MTAHNLGAIRKAKLDYVLKSSDNVNSVTIPKDSYIGASHIALGFDTKLWGENVQEYNPNRFDPALRDPNSSQIWIPFSGGIHMCPGRFLAVNIMKIIAVIMLKHYRLELDGKMPTMNYERATISQRNGPVLLKCVHQ
jgi:cytochrome P450